MQGSARAAMALLASSNNGGHNDLTVQQLVAMVKAALPSKGRAMLNHFKIMQRCGNTACMNDWRASSGVSQALRGLARRPKGVSEQHLLDVCGFIAREYGTGPRDVMTFRKEWRASDREGRAEMAQAMFGATDGGRGCSLVQLEMFQSESTA